MKKLLMLASILLLVNTSNIKAEDIDSQLKTLSDIKYTQFTEQRKTEFKIIYKEARRVIDLRPGISVIDFDKIRAQEAIRRHRKTVSQQTVTRTIPPMQAVTSKLLYGIDYFEVIGVIRWGGYKFTYYSERVLPGGGLNIPGRHTSGGFVRDKDGYIVAAQKGPKGIIIPTPFGADAKVYDYCEGCTVGHIDLYTR